MGTAIEVTKKSITGNKVITWDQCVVTGVEAKEFVLQVKAGESAHLMIESYVLDKDGKNILTANGDHPDDGTLFLTKKEFYLVEHPSDTIRFNVIGPLAGPIKPI
jgi:hypothetical protein